MALSFIQEPTNSSYKIPVITNWTPLIGYMLYRDTSIAALYYYKLVLEVRLNSSTGALLAKFKQRRNGYSDDVTNNRARAFFDLRDVANSVLVNTVYDQNLTGIPFSTIHKLGANSYDGGVARIFSRNGDFTRGEYQITSLYVKGYENYSNNVDVMPVDITTDAVNDTMYYMRAALPLLTPRSTVVSPVGYIQDNAFEIYQANNPTDRFLSDAADNNVASGDGWKVTGRINYIHSGDYHTVAFLNDESVFGSEAYQMEIEFFDSDGNKIGSTAEIENKQDNGGWIPDGSEGTTVDKHRLLYFGCGPANLEAFDDGGANNQRPSNHSGWVYYTVRGIGTKASPTNETDVYYFVLQDRSCKGYQVRRLGWVSSVGGYDYFNFTKKSTQTIDIKRNNYNSMLGTFNKSLWRYNNTQRGKTTREVTATLKETLNTGWLTEQDAVFMENLLLSGRVDVVQNGDTTYTEGVIITDSSFVKKTIANDNLIQYTVNIEYSNPINTNS